MTGDDDLVILRAVLDALIDRRVLAGRVTHVEQRNVELQRMLEQARAAEISDDSEPEGSGAGR